MRLQFAPLARRELHRAAAWYDTRSPGAGDRFYADVEASIAHLTQFPNAQPIVSGEYRKLLLRRFPYALIYRQLNSQTLLIVAVAHQKRKPGYWRRRTSKE